MIPPPAPPRIVTHAAVPIGVPPPAHSHPCRRADWGWERGWGYVRCAGGGQRPPASDQQFQTRLSRDKGGSIHNRKCKAERGANALRWAGPPTRLRLGGRLAPTSCERGLRSVCSTRRCRSHAAPLTRKPTQPNPTQPNLIQPVSAMPPTPKNETDSVRWHLFFLGEIVPRTQRL